uniref:PI4-kinase N-terminal domain-containing protein n=1 Tax=Romanomermis culicivorax TaxID=13658 RepID=A0A915L0V3_ROMCU
MTDSGSKFLEYRVLVEQISPSLQMFRNINIQMFIRTAIASPETGSTMPSKPQKLLRPRNLLTQPVEPLIDYSTCLYQKHGTSFSNVALLKNLKSLQTDSFHLSDSEINTIFMMLKTIVKRDVISAFDNHATDVYMAASIKRFPYRTIHEVMMLSVVSLLKDLLLYEDSCISLNFSSDHAKEVQSLARSIFSLAQADLASRQSDSLERDKCGREININKYKTLVYTNAICIELAVWAAADEGDADNICTRIAEKLNASHGYRNVMSHMSLLMACLEATGTLAEKFPTIACTSIVPILIDFLLSPSHLLLKLTVGHESKSEKSVTKDAHVGFSSAYFEQGIKSCFLNGKSSASDGLSKSIKRRQIGFEKLRDSAIKNLCRSLKAGLALDHNCVQACLANISTRLYVAREAEHTSIIICQNALMAIGGIGTWLSDTPGIPEAVMQIFQQKFATPPSPLDSIIVNEMAEMVIAGCYFSIQKYEGPYDYHMASHRIGKSWGSPMASHLADDFW